MPQKKEKKVKGKASRYISRSKAIRKLGLSLSAFRRLCIYKGIYPRDQGSARKKLKKISRAKIYYYKKEISHLINDPTTSILRQQNAYTKKFMRLIGERKWLEARNLEDNRPKVLLDRVIAERYPTFTEALTDLGDCLTLIFAIASLGGTAKLKQEDVRACNVLGLEFKNYVVKTRCLQKVFVTIKGFYYQVNIMNTPITWSEPFKFVQRIPSDARISILDAFLHLYKTLLKFILIHLYKTAGLTYPPKVNLEENNLDSGLAELVVETRLTSLVKDGLREEIAIKASDDKLNRKKLVDQIKMFVDSKKECSTTPDASGVNEEEVASQEPTADLQNTNNDSSSIPQEEDVDWNEANEESERIRTLFSGCCFFLSRETPKASLEFVIRSCGGICGWDQYGCGRSHMDENSDKITHHVVDRPLHSPNTMMNRVYVQPQWIYDSVNRGTLLSTVDYAPGNPLPPHLSPFAVYGELDYVPASADRSALPSIENSGTDENIDKQPSIEADVDEGEVDEEYELYKSELEAEAKGMRLSEYMQSEYNARTGLPPENENAKIKNSPTSKPRKSLKANKDGQELEKERKQFALSLLSKRSRKRYEILSKKQKRISAAAEILKDKKAKLASKEKS